jgi:hypothetical protein
LSSRPTKLPDPSSQALRLSAGASESYPPRALASPPHGGADPSGVRHLVSGTRFHARRRGGERPIAPGARSGRIEGAGNCDPAHRNPGDPKGLVRDKVENPRRAGASARRKCLRPRWERLRSTRRKAKCKGGEAGEQCRASVRQGEVRFHPGTGENPKGEERQEGSSRREISVSRGSDSRRRSKL